LKKRGFTNIDREGYAKLKEKGVMQYVLFRHLVMFPN
jgi:hypothetical protein